MTGAKSLRKTDEAPNTMDKDRTVARGLEQGILVYRTNNMLFRNAIGVLVLVPKNKTAESFRGGRLSLTEHSREKIVCGES